MDLDAILQGYMDKLSERAPEFRVLMDRAKAGEITEQEAMGAMLQAIGEDPELKKDLEVMAKDMIPVAPAQETGLWQPSGDLPEFMFRGKTGIPQLNPLYEASLVERAQFDGDIPELRYGPLPEGVAPAIPVKTNARQPAALGQMLEDASAKVRADIDASEGQRRKEIEAAVEAVAEGTDKKVLALMGKHGELVAKEGMDIAKANWGSAETDIPTFKRGEVPKALSVPKPSGSALISMTPQQRRERAWKFLSTTQGRRTAVETIRELVAKSLRDGGLDVVERDIKPGDAEEPLAAHEWSLSLGGAGSTQDSFSVIDVAARALGKGLERKLVGLPITRVYLEITAINAVDVRTVGWAARVLG